MPSSTNEDFYQVVPLADFEDYEDEAGWAVASYYGEKLLEYYTERETAENVRFVLEAAQHTEADIGVIRSMELRWYDNVEQTLTQLRVARD